MEGFTKLVLLLATATIIGAQNLENKTYDDRIIGGSNAQRGQFPFIVSIEQNNQFMCGGSILSQSWIISAAHCFYGYSRQDQFVVFAGLLQQNERHQNPEVQRSQINGIYIHQQYQDGGDYPNDIAMARLVTPLRFGRGVQNINLPRGSMETVGSNAVTIGWGRTETGQISNSLKYFTAPVLSNNDCQRDVGPLLPTQICTKFGPPHQGACRGDSGGPLMQNNVLIGISSWVVNDCRSGPTAYTRVSSFLPFINSHLSH